jgi:hypothetical protein
MIEAPQETMKTVNVTGPGPTFVAEIQVFYKGDEFVEVSPVLARDLAACTPGRFQPPGGPWGSALPKLQDFHALIVTGERGTGRRTAALRLLTAVSATGPLQEITPTWKRPRTDLLPPAEAGQRYLLDISEEPEMPALADFGGKLLAWSTDASVYLVVTTTEEAWTRRWTASAGEAVVRLRSPNARALAASEIQSAGAVERTTVLDDPVFDDIWKSAPKGEDACRLARLVIDRGDSRPDEIASEYRNWRSWIDEELPGKELPERAIIWSAAFCDGGQGKSVLRMSEDLRRLLGEKRGPADILKDAPASKRLKDAWIEPGKPGEGVRLSPEKHGLAAALRAYLWGEYEDAALREKLTDWIAGQLGELPINDTERVVNGMLDIVISYRDDTLLRALRDKLTDDRRPLAVRALSTAALDPKFGAHVRNSLYKWATTVKDQRVIDLVIEVCGGTFGERMPGMALVRLGWAAQKSRPGSRALATALTALAARDPDGVLASLDRWFTDFAPPTAGINGFLALASTEQGAVLLSNSAKSGSGHLGFKEKLTWYFERALAEPESKKTAYSVLKSWEKLAEEGEVNEGTAIAVLGMALAPQVKDNVFWELLPHGSNINGFWGRVFTTAIRVAGMDAGAPAQ